MTLFLTRRSLHTLPFSLSLLTVLSLCSPPSLLCLLYALRKGYVDQCPLNLSSASVCAKIIGDSPPAASGANIRSLLLQGVPFVVSTALAGRLDPVCRCHLCVPSHRCTSFVFICLLVHLFLSCVTLCTPPPRALWHPLCPGPISFIAQSVQQH